MKTLDVNKTQVQELEVLDTAILTAIDNAQKSFETDNGLTIEEARELNRKRYQACLNTPELSIKFGD